MVDARVEIDVVAYKPRGLAWVVPVMRSLLREHGPGIAR